VIKKINLENAIVLGVGFGVILFFYLFRRELSTAWFNAASMLIVLVGTFCAACLNFSFAKVLRAFGAAKKLFLKKPDTTQKDIQLLMEFVKFARNNGVLALSSMVNLVENKFMKKCLKTAIDEDHDDIFEKKLEAHLGEENKEDSVNIDIFEELGGYAPTFGIVGAIVGLIHVTSSTSDIQALMPGIAAAFCATLWGLALANLVFLPISGNLKNELRDKITFQNAILKGVRSIYHNQSHLLLQDDLRDYIKYEL